MNFFFAVLQALGLVTSAVERYVTDTGTDTDDGAKATPYLTIGRALQDANTLAAGQRLVIHVSGTKPFVETLTVPSHVTIEGPAEIRASAPGPAVKIVGTAAASVTEVELNDLKISGQGPFTGDGGAVFVDRANGVILDDCELHESVAGRGGGIAILRSTDITVSDCRIHDNTAGTQATTLANADLVPLPITLPTGSGHGGGIFVRDSDAEIVECEVTENQAILFGGGIAISNDQRFESAVEVRDCQVTSNQVSHPNLAALGAPTTRGRPDMGDPVHAEFADTLLSAAQEAKALALLHGMNFESGLGGGIGVRFASNTTRILRCKIGVTRAGKEGANVARRGGGVSLYIGASPTLEENEIAHNIAGGDGGGISIDLFDPFLPPGEAELFGVRAVAMLPRNLTTLNRNHLHGNHALEDGGGLYATGAARVVVKGGVVERNRAGEIGGGLRATYAAHLHAEGVTIRANEANVLPAAVSGGAAAGAGDREGGGGVGVRNAIAHLENCEFVGNRANSFAGGAVYFTSAFEGGIDSVAGVPVQVENQRGRFDQIMEGPFGFRTRVLRIVNCRGSGNQALGASGAGGFLYAVRSPTLGGVESMWVSVEGPRTAIGANESHHGTPAGGRKRGNVVVELSGRLVGGAGPDPEDRVHISGEIPAAGIAASTPPPNDRAVVVMVDGDAAHDLVRSPWNGLEFLHGPAPTVAAVTPALASTRGGTRLRVTGTGFEDGTIVLLAGRAAAGVSRTNTELRVDSPAAAAGPADVTVVGPAGPRRSLAAAVRVLPPPTIRTLTPARGVAGTAVKMTGTSFVPGTKVHIVSGGNAVEAVVVTAAGEKELTFTAPASPGAGPVDVRVTAPSGDTAVKPAAFRYTQ